MIEVRAPGRVDLAGGTLDLWPLYCLHPGAVTVNVAVDARVRVAAAARPDQPSRVAVTTAGAAERTVAAADAGTDLIAAVALAVRPEGALAVEVRQQLPVGSGLGGSSVLAVAVATACLAVAGRPMSPGRLVALLRDVEARVLRAPTGVQDYYPAVLGGALAIGFPAGGEEVAPVDVAAEWVNERLAVVDTGIAHHSGMVNWEVYRRRIDGDEVVTACLDEIAAAGRDCRAALAAHDGVGVAAAMRRDWEARRRLAPGVTTPDVDAVIGAGLRAGALAGKACGAGGGGCVAFWTAPGAADGVAAAAAAAGGDRARVVPVRMDSDGVRVSEVGGEPL